MDRQTMETIAYGLVAYVLGLGIGVWIGWEVWGVLT